MTKAVLTIATASYVLHQLLSLEYDKAVDGV